MGELLTLTSVFGKYLWIPFLGFMGWLTNKYISNQDDKIRSLQKDYDKQRERIVDLEKDLRRSYYDKQEVDRHLDNKLTPIRESLMEVSSSVKALTGTITEIHQDMAILKYKILGGDKGR